MKFTFDIDGFNHYREVELELGERKTLSFEIAKDIRREVIVTFHSICSPFAGYANKFAILKLDYVGGRTREEMFMMD